MKKLVFGLLFVAGVAVASQMGPYGYDEKGAQISSGLGLAGVTVVQMNLLTPAYTGEIIFCSNCLQSALCVSSGTTTGGWTVIAGTSTVGGGSLLGHCQ